MPVTPVNSLVDTKIIIGKRSGCGGGKALVAKKLCNSAKAFIFLLPT
jgi:hypothetical protein